MRFAGRVKRCFEMDHVAGLEVLGRTVKGQGLQAVQLLVDVKNAVRAVVTVANRYSGGAEEDI